MGLAIDAARGWTRTLRDDAGAGGAGAGGRPGSPDPAPRGFGRPRGGRPAVGAESARPRAGAGTRGGSRGRPRGRRIRAGPRPRTRRGGAGVRAPRAAPWGTTGGGRAGGGGRTTETLARA